MTSPALQSAPVCKIGGMWEPSFVRVDMGRVANDMPDREAPAMIPGELGELLVQIERERAPERLLELAVQLQSALARWRMQSEPGDMAINGRAKAGV